MENIDSVPSNVQFARQEALLFVFEDNEAVIKMIIKGRSLTMRHVSRTHRVALDWLFDRINLDSKIQIKYIDTKNQLADILTKGNFTRDGRCSKIIENSQIGVSRHFGSVYHDTNGQNHGPVWKTQSFLLNEICMVILCYRHHVEQSQTGCTD